MRKPLISRALVLAAVALCGAGRVAADPAPNPANCPGETTDPALIALYPAAARAGGVEGRAYVSCMQDVHAALGPCQVLAEDPEAHGFGDAAMAMLAQSRGNPAVNYTPAQVALPITFIVSFSLHPLGISPNLVGQAHVVQEPKLRATPSDAEIGRAYPLRAESAHINGRALIDCAVALDRSLHDCKVAYEAPKGEGFGEHALGLASDYTVEPARCDGKPVTGSRIAAPIAFTAPR